MVDLGFIGQKFTWTVKRGVNESIWERLDRTLCYKEWRIIFTEDFLEHLPRVSSDHCTILLNLYSHHIMRRDFKPFRFEAMWLKHREFSSMTKQFWESRNECIVDKITVFSSKLREWNEEEFGCIFQRKRRLLARLQGVQRSLGVNFKACLTKLEAKLQEEYSQIIEQEEMFWFQKSRLTWLKEGDKNT
ncbi:hypothetical protein Ddye_024303 [Dipteronia dyeriana]|uniref:Reverse transcriptase n=1 Tax=Dipteronia dyeriana TaxID=168575 RepID=A0AAD9WUB5_9ROSI|nr:hypothetical protein Ddye_024303 [Dipteronia dyeriana]